MTMPKCYRCRCQPCECADGITLYHADCRDVLPLLETGSVDLVLTDPPYDQKTHLGARYGFRATSSEIPFPPLEDIPGLVGDLLRVSRRWVIAFCSLEMFGSYKQAAGECWIRAGLWRRPNGVPQFTGDRPGQPAEGLAIMHNPGSKRWYGGGKHGFWVHNIQQHGRFHPTEKPIGLISELLADFSSAEETILDPFAGSGTTGRACKDLGRRCIMVEIEEKYCDIAARRLEQGVLFI